VPSQQVNRRVLENLIKCGAFDSIHRERSRVFSALDQAIQRAQEINRGHRDGQLSLFGFMGLERKDDEELPEMSEWDASRELTFEKESLGYYISGHPMDSLEDRVMNICTANTDTITKQRVGSEVIICGLLSLIKEISTRKGERMGFINLEDKYGRIEVVTFPETYRKIRPYLEDDEPFVLVGQYQHDENKGKLIASKIMSIEEAHSQAIKAIALFVEAGLVDEKLLNQLKSILVNAPGSCPVSLHVLIPGHSETIIALNGKLRVNPSSELLTELHKLLGKEKVRPELANNNNKKG